MKLILVCCFSVFLFLILDSCDTNEPLPQGAVGLTLEDVSCTEAWITLTTGNLSNTAYIKIMSNGKLLQTLDVSATETLLYYDTLQPNTNYEFQAFSSQRGEDVIGNKLKVTTLDTTSHNFTWQTFTLGEHSSSVLYDVVIINENNIWAVGEIYMNDSLGNPDPNSYNAVHWDGTNWELKKIGGYGGWVCRTVFAFSENDVWFEGTIKWDGVNYTVHKNGFPLEPNGDGWVINKMWGSTSSDLYAVGNNGNIAHYNGSAWTKIESGTTSIINDVWGITNNQNNNILYCPVSSFFVPGDKKILMIIDGKVDSVSWNRDVRLYSTWTNNENFLYVCGEGAYVNKFGSWNEIVLQLVGTNSIRGNGLNDIFIDGDYGFTAHFNGLNWHIYNNNYLKGYSRLSFKGDIVAIAGNYQGKAIVEIGRRN